MNDQRNLLVVDDDPLTLECFRLLFPVGEVAVVTAESASEGLAIIGERPVDAVVLDVRLPDLSGLDAFRRFHELNSKVPIILMTGHGTAETAIEAMRMGAFEYVLKPLDPPALRELILRAFEISRLMRVPAKMEQSERDDGQVDLLVGQCPSMQEVYKSIGRVASQDVTVLILGASGTGKELVARAIYHYSTRANGPFLAFNCAAIPDSLLESELFGHEKGAFTGADRKRIGKFEQCNEGTLFLDEIGEMAPMTQAKILRVLQDREFERVGGNELIKTNVRIIAATNRDLDAMVAAGKFREDLYYRLNVFSIKLPPLGERGDDLPLLAEHFVKRFSREMKKEVVMIAPETIALLAKHTWPGNVRELQSVLKQAILKATGPMLLPDFLPDSILPHTGGATPTMHANGLNLSDLMQFVDDRLKSGATHLHAEFQALTERQLLLHVLRHTESNLSQAARILGISRATLRNKLASYGITIDRTASLEGEGSG